MGISSENFPIRYSIQPSNTECMNVLREKQRIAKAQKVLELIERFEERINTIQGWIEYGVFPATIRDHKNLDFGRQGKLRLERYYHYLMRYGSST